MNTLEEYLKNKLKSLKYQEHQIKRIIAQVERESFLIIPWGDANISNYLKHFYWDEVKRFL